jgi:hypothetical protein
MLMKAIGFIVQVLFEYKKYTNIRYIVLMIGPIVAHLLAAGLERKGRA